MAKKTLSFESHAAKYQLDEEEQNLLREIEDGEWGAGPDSSQRIEDFKADTEMLIQEQAEQRMELLTGQMAKSEGVNEELKAADQMSWVAKMNNIRHSAEEIVLTELIYI